MNDEIHSPNGGLPRLGLIGAGRVGEAIAKVWLARTGGEVVVWSKSGRRSPDNRQERIIGGAWVDSWVRTLTADAVIAAIPGSVLLSLASNCIQAQSFDGRLYSAAVSLSQEILQQSFPKALVIRIAPFLIDENNSIPMLVLRPPAITDSVWKTVESELAVLGAIDVVEDEHTYDQITLLGSPWPAVVNAAIGYAANIGVGDLLSSDTADLGRRIFFRAMRSFLSAPPYHNVESREAPDIIATPGGITERGLQHVKEIAKLMEHVFSQMRERAEELRAEIANKNNDL